MSWPSEMEMVDQLCGGDLPLPVICSFFRDDAHARQVLGHYISRGVVVFLGRDGELAIWTSLEITRDPVPLNGRADVRVSLTSKGAKAFEDGTWSDI